MAPRRRDRAAGPRDVEARGGSARLLGPLSSTDVAFHAAGGGAEQAGVLRSTKSLANASSARPARA
ncbi:Hypothetical protein A7982_06244 [Minicystis rosea]|nr:Hypothetical protein A7982_06244 [Minicystis rosea]